METRATKATDNMAGEEVITGTTEEIKIKEVVIHILINIMDMDRSPHLQAQDIISPIRLMKTSTGKKRGSTGEILTEIGGIINHSDD